jgi:hypothetical protein
VNPGKERPCAAGDGKELSGARGGRGDVAMHFLVCSSSENDRQAQLRDVGIKLTINISNNIIY